MRRSESEKRAVEEKRVRKCTTLVVCLFMVLWAVIVIVEIPSVRADFYPVVYVDDDYDDPPPPYYKTIADGIGNVEVDGIVYVNPGDYDEQITISKNLSIVENATGEIALRRTTGDAYIMTITNSSNVYISGLTIYGRSNTGMIGITIKEDSHVNIRNCSFLALNTGIHLWSGSSAWIDHNLYHRDANYTYNTYGARFVKLEPQSKGEYTAISNNTVIMEKEGWGISAQSTAISLVENNSIYQNYSGWDCLSADNQDKSAAVVLYQYGVPGITIMRNNRMSGFCFGTTTVEANVLIDNDTIESCHRGIALQREHNLPHGSNLTVRSSVINNSGEIGISVSVASNITVEASNIVNNPIGVVAHSKAESVTVAGSNFSNNAVGVKTYGKDRDFVSFRTEVLDSTLIGNGEGVHSEWRDVIDGNHFNSNEEGIRLQTTSYAQIRNNVITNTTVRPGIWIWKSTSNTLTNNSISEGLTGILANDGSNGNKIEDCVIWSNDFGIHIDESDQVNMVNNDVSGNYESGILISNSAFTNISQANITNNYVGIDVQYSSNTLITDSSLLGNVLWAVNATNYVNASGNYFGTNDTHRIDKLVSENVNFSNPLPFRESGVNYTDTSLILQNDTQFSKGQIINGNLTINPGVNVTFTNTTGHNFIQVNGQFVVVNGSYLESAQGNFTLLATNGSSSDMLNARFEKQMGIGIQTANMTVTNCTFANGTAGIVVNQGVSNVIQDSDFISNSRYGVYLFGSSSNIIQDNLIALSRNGIQAYNSTLDSLSWNNISANEFGIKVGHSSNASIHNNTVTNNFVGIEVRASMYININNNTIVGNVQLAISVPPFTIGTDAHYNYFGTNDSDQVDKLCSGVDCSNWTNATDSSFDYIDVDVHWSTPQNLTKGVIVEGNLTIDTQVTFCSALYQNFIQVNGRLQVNSSSLDGSQGMFTILYLNKSSGGFENSNLNGYRGVGVQSESDFITNGSSFVNGTYGVSFWLAKNGRISNSTFESGGNWAIGLFHSEQVEIETSEVHHTTTGIYVFSSCSNIIQSNEIWDSSIGVWLDSKPLLALYVSPKYNEITSNEFHYDDIGVLASYSDGNTVSSNVFSGDWTGTGVELSGIFAKNMTVELNEFKDNEYGILISDSSENEIDNNTFTNNGRSIDIDSSNFVLVPYPPVNPNNLITANNISADGSSTFGIRMYDTDYNIVGSNTISITSGHTGIWMEESHNNTLDDNAVSSSSSARTANGIRLQNAGGNNLTKNTITLFTYNFGVVGEVLWDFVQEIDSNNTVDGRKVYYWVDENGNDSYYASDGGYYGFVNSSRIIVENVSKIQHNLQGYLLAYSDHIQVRNVSVSDTSDGVLVYKSSDSVIEDGILTYNHQGINLHKSSLNVISNVTASNSVGGAPRPGIHLEESTYNLLTNNTTVSQNKPGIRLYSSSYNTISHSKVTDQEGNNQGIAVLYSNYNNITHCEISENTYYGIDLLGSYYTSISNNTITGNRYGIRIYGNSNNNLVVDNYIQDSLINGVLLQAAENVLSYNNISGSGGNGIYMENAFGLPNAITYNNFTNNTGWGVKVTSSGGWNEIHHNNFICNRGNCSNGYQGYDAVMGTPHNWDDGNVGNYWTNESWQANGGWYESPKTYYVAFDQSPLIKDRFPQDNSFMQAGPR